MNVDEIRELVAKRLPSRYGPLELTFYGPRARPNADLVIIGDDRGTDLCVSLADGTVYSVDPQRELPTRFVNSSIEEFARFIEVSENVSIAENTDGEAVARLMREALAKIDPAAFSNPENWWAVVLEQMAYGL
jgi:hypothetical protein